jgi:hypothetical protein
LFAPIGREQPAPIEVELRFRSQGGERGDWTQVPYSYASPVELLDRKNLEYDPEWKKLNREQLSSMLLGKAVSFVKQYHSDSGFPIELYAFVVDGKEANRLLRERQDRGEFAPNEPWQRLTVSTRDMPTGVEIGGGPIQPRTYERRMFVLMQYDELRLDLGRKTLAGSTANMLRKVLKRAWENDLRFWVTAVGPSEHKISAVSLAQLKSAIRDGRRLPDLDLDVPYLKQPDEALGVLALYHELISGSDPVVPRLKTLRTGVFRGTDALAYAGTPNGKDPLHVLFALDVKNLINQLEDDERSAETVSLAVIWRLDWDYLNQVSIGVEEAAADDVASHQLVLGGIGGRDALDALILDPTSAQHA